MNTLRDVYRHTFPKRLRFDKASLILHAEILTISRRHKHKKYIPKEEIRDVLDRYTPLPGAPLLQLPVIRHILLVRQINGIRCLFGYRSWLVNRAVDEEFHKIQQWLHAQEHLSGKSMSGGRIGDFVLRERFVKEVVDVFHVATMYHRMVRLGTLFVIIVLFLVFASVNVDAVVYFYLVHWCGMRRSDVLSWFRTVAERHVLTEVPPAYESLLPPPCVRRAGPDGRALYALRVAEFVSANGQIVVMAIPCPLVGERMFFEAIGDSARLCDAIVMEGVPFDRIDKIVPAAIFPLRDDTFPALGLHHRFLDIVRGSDKEPPLLFPAGARLGWRPYVLQFIIPFGLRCVYWPTVFAASKGEARYGWGRVRELIERVAAQQQEEEEEEEKYRGKGKGSEGAAAAPYVICLPWTVHQIVNLEASLVKYGFRVRRVFQMDWMDCDHMGEHFCNYYGITE